MRPLILSLSALVWAGCAANTEPRPPPTDRFVYPTGIVHRQVADSPNGALYVASANFDKCFDTGAVLALDLDSLGLPGLGEAVGDPLEITQLNVRPEAQVQIESFAGEMSVWEPGDGRPARLFVPTRAEQNYLHAIDIEGKTTLQCAQDPESDSCIDGALSLTSNISGSSEDLPRAPAPIGVTVGLNAENQPEVWVTHIEAADSPARTARGFQTYVVRLPADELSLTADNFIRLSSGGLSIGGAHATALGSRYAYVSGRTYVANQTQQGASFLLRLIDREESTRVLETNLRSIYQTLEARDIELGVSMRENTERLYIVTRFPDTLLVVDVEDPQSLRPRVAVVDAVPLPDAASQLVVIPREGLGDLVAVATSSIEGVVVLYDDALGEIVAQIAQVGRQPYGIGVDRRADAARLYVSNFGDGRVAVIDIPNLGAAQGARLVAYLGARQGRDVDQGTSTCTQQEDEP